MALFSKIRITALLFLMAAAPAWAIFSPPVNAGDILAYPQPARNYIYFSADIPSTGTLKIEVYNVAMQHVATFSENALATGTQTFFEQSLGPLVSGPYFYKSSINGFHFPTHKLWIQR